MTDRWLKVIARQLGPETSYRLLGDWGLFRFTPNTYISFSIPFSGILLNIIIILLIIGIIYYIFTLILDKNKRISSHSDWKITIILLTIVLFGAISNIQDRLLYGYVVDYLELKYFTVFNIADIMISVSTIILIVRTLRTKK